MFVVIVLLLVIAALLLSVKASREPILEWVKELSDKLLLGLLRATSQFEGELTQEGRQEQALWRERRLRDLRGLAARSAQRFDKKQKSA